MTSTARKVYYQKHPLSRILTVHELVSADYVAGLHPAVSHHIHSDAYELCYCHKGDLSVLREETYAPIHAGQCTLVKPGILHDSLTVNPATKTFYISFTCEGDSMLLFQDTVFDVNPAQTILLEQIILELNHTYQLYEGELRLFDFTLRDDMPLGAEQLICCELEQFLISLLRGMTMRNGELITNSQFDDARERYFIMRVQEYIREHIADGLSVDNLARIFHYSRSRLFTHFKLYTGKSVGQYISYEQLELAKKLLLENELSVVKISELAGFSSPQYFSRRFREEVGCPPSKFAKNSKNI